MFFFLKLCFFLFTIEVLLIQENVITFFFLFFPKIRLLPYHPHLSPNIYNFVIDIDTSTTMNYQIKSVNVLKFRFFSHPFSFHIHKNHISYTFSQNSLKKTEDFDYKLCKVHKLTILGD